jgi:uncharacterized RDD family membrane protein YckC
MICAACGATSADGAAFCRSCGQPIVGYSVGGSSAGSMPIAGQPAGVYAGPSGGAVAARMPLYAGFWLRFVAAFIDGLVLLIPMGLILVLMFASALPMLRTMGGGAPPNPMMIMPLFLSRFLFFAVIVLLGSWLYWGFLESSEWQGTLGKKALGLYVTDLEGRRLTFGKASGRFWAGRGISSVPTIGGLYYLIDCIMAGFTERKQALHDMIAGCLVMRSS